jgi:hypothetical protein
MNGLVRTPHPRGRSVGLADGRWQLQTAMGQHRWCLNAACSRIGGSRALSAFGVMSERSLHGAQFIEMHDESLTCRLSAASAKRCAVPLPAMPRAAEVLSSFVLCYLQSIFTLRYSHYIGA